MLWQTLHFKRWPSQPIGLPRHFPLPLSLPLPRKTTPTVMGSDVGTSTLGLPMVATVRSSGELSPLIFVSQVLLVLENPDIIGRPTCHVGFVGFS